MHNFCFNAIPAWLSLESAIGWSVQWLLLEWQYGQHKTYLSWTLLITLQLFVQPFKGDAAEFLVGNRKEHDSTPDITKS